MKYYGGKTKNNKKRICHKALSGKQTETWLRSVMVFYLTKDCGQKLAVTAPWVSEKAMAPHSSTLAWKSHGRRSLVGCSPWGREESDMTERLHFHFSLSCIREGNGNPRQCLAWRIPGTGEPDGLPSMGSHRVGHDWSDSAAAAAPWV